MGWEGGGRECQFGWKLETNREKLHDYYRIQIIKDQSVKTNKKRSNGLKVNIRRRIGSK